MISLLSVLKGAIWIWNMYSYDILENRFRGPVQKLLGARAQMHMQYTEKKNWTIIFVPPCSYLFWNYVWFSSISRFGQKKYEKRLRRVKSIIRRSLKNSDWKKMSDGVYEINITILRWHNLSWKSQKGPNLTVRHWKPFQSRFFLQSSWNIFGLIFWQNISSALV